MPSPAPRQSFMNFFVWFTDIDEFNFAWNLASSHYLVISPDDAATLFGVSPWPATDPWPDSPKGLWFPDYAPGDEILWQHGTGVFITADNVGPYFVAAEPGNPPSIFPANPDHDTDYYWACNFVYENRAAAGTNPPPSPNVIPQRRWIMGAEMGQGMEGGSGTISSQTLNRDASRTGDGVGMGWRGISTTSLATRQVDEYRTTLTTRTSWERFYFRARRQAASNATIWRCHNSVQASAGCFLRWASTGEIRAVDMTGFAVQRDQGEVFTPTIGTWYKIDILLKYGDGTVGSGHIAFYVNEVREFEYIPPDNSGMSLNGNHSHSDIGPAVDSMVADVEWDCDDWICADLPDNIDPDDLSEIAGEDFPMDWNMGSHVRRVFINPTTGSSTNWTGSRSVMNQGMTPGSQLTNQLTSNTSGARMEAITEIRLQDVLEGQYPALGVVAAIITLNSTNAGATDGQVGYKLAGGADVLATVNQAGAFSSVGAAYFQQTQFLPVEASPFHIIHTKSTDANLDTTRALQAIVEFIGAWGPEDQVSTIPGVLTYADFKHNNRFWNSEFGFVGPAPFALVYSKGGTYVGNGTYQEITLPTACHFIVIRNTAAATSGLRWMACSLDSHRGATRECNPNLRVFYDFDNDLFKFAVSGNDTDCNQSAVTYQYIVFCDPGMQYCISGSFYHSNSISAPQANPLLDPTFTPECAFTQYDVTGGVSSTAGFSFKGPGNSGNTGQMLSGANLANWGTLSTGFINSNSDLHGTPGQVNYLAFRSANACAESPMAIVGQYTGNGSNPRTINITVTGRFPLFILVVPVAVAAAFYRDPSHTGSNSSNFDSGANSTLAITAVGMDSFTVNSSLNTNLVVYNYVVFPGDSAGMLNGEYFSYPCDPSSAVYDSDPPVYVPGPDIIGDGGIILGGGTGAAITLLRDISGIYTLVADKRNDTLMDRQTGQTSVDVEIPDPTFKTGYIGG